MRADCGEKLAIVSICMCIYFCEFARVCVHLFMYELCSRVSLSVCVCVHCALHTFFSFTSKL